MRLRALLALVALAAALTAACSAAGFFRQYEYEEETYLSLDGTATIYVNASVDALDALRGTAFSTKPTALVDRAAVRAYFTSPITHVTSVSTSRRNGRRFVHVRLDVSDVTRLGEVAPFAWSTYEFRRDGDLFIYRQTIGAAAGRRGPDAGWNGSELVAFRLHIPAKIRYHNTLPGNLKRGNILVWEQPLADRLRGVPLTLDARMETESILYRTLYLFGATFVAVAMMFAAIIWWILRVGRRRRAAETGARG